MVNVNVCYTAFYKEQNLAEAMEEFKNASFGGLIDKYIEGVRVSPTHVSRIIFLSCSRVCSYLLVPNSSVTDQRRLCGRSVVTLLTKSAFTVRSLAVW